MKEATTIPDRDSTVFNSSNDESKEVSPVDSIDTDLAVIITKTSFLKYVNESGYSNHNYVSIKLFDTFYDDSIEYKHYVNDILQNCQF